MATEKVNIADWARGTTPPMVIRAQSEGVPYSLVGCTLVMVIRAEAWEDSLTDDTALVKRRAKFWEVVNMDGLVDIASPIEGDIAWIDDDAIARMWDGENWVEANSAENYIIGGVYTFRFTRDEMMLDVGKYYYSVDIMMPDGEIGKIVKGKINITDNTVNEVF